MGALLPLIVLPACIEVDPPPPPPVVDPELAYAMFPVNLAPDELVVERGDVIGVLGATPSNVNPDHEVNFSGHYLIQCVANEGEFDSDHWPPCSLAIAEGYVVIEDPVGRELGSFSCNATLNYVPGGPINPSVSHCAVLTGNTNGQGPGVEWSGAWRVTGCDPTWIAYRHTRSFDSAPANSAALPALSDTTRITVAQPCGSG